MITDFVHLNWHFITDSDYPTKDGWYFCLINPADISPDTELKTLFYDSDVGMFFEEEDLYLKYLCVVAWVDPTKYTFTCDPNKNDKCDKGTCFNSPYSDHSRTCCYLTTHLEYAKGYDFH